MQFTHEIEQMCCVKKGCNHGPAPIPQEGNWTQSKEITDISGLTHGVGWCEAACPSAPVLKTSARASAPRSAPCTAPAPRGPRYLEMAEGYITKLALDEDGEIIGYEFVRMGPMMEMIKKGVDANEAVAKCTGNYGRFDEAAKYIDPRHE